MSYDWDEQQRKNQEDIEKAKVNMNRMARVRDFDKYWSQKELDDGYFDKITWKNRWADPEDFDYRDKHIKSDSANYRKNCNMNLTFVKLFLNPLIEY